MRATKHYHYHYKWESESHWREADGDPYCMPYALKHGWEIIGLEDELTWVLRDREEDGGRIVRVRWEFHADDSEERFLQEMLAAKWREEHKEKGQK